MRILRAVYYAVACVCSLLAVPTDANGQGRCRQIATVCAEGPETRNINGLAVYRDCWRYSDTYECVDPSSVDHCAPIAATSSCYQLTAVCAETAFDGTCLRQSREWRCNDPFTPDPPNVTRLPDTHTITGESIDDSACTLLASTTGCARTGARVCVDGPATRNINGLDVTRDCWRWQERFVCTDTTGTVSNCASLESNPTCTVESESCTDTNTTTGACNMITRVYRCVDTPASTTPVTTCGTLTCIAGICDNADDPPDGDMVKAITSLEVARQAAGYFDPATMTVFGGVADRCSRQLYGLVNCCSARVKAGTSGAGMRVSNVHGGPEAIALLGSDYTHDALFGDSLVPTSKLNDLYRRAGDSYADMDLWGMTWTTAVGFAIDPVRFTLAVSEAMMPEFLSCSEDEQRLALRKGQNLCHYVGSWCSTRDPFGGCVTKREGYCCFNSVLGRIINQQGRAQIGKSWGTAESPDCSGFTLDELRLLDFSAMDLSEFFVQVRTTSINTAAVQTRANAQVDTYRTGTPGAYVNPPPATGTCVGAGCP